MQPSSSILYPSLHWVQQTESDAHSPQLSALQREGEGEGEGEGERVGEDVIILVVTNEDEAVGLVDVTEGSGIDDVEYESDEL